VVDSHRRGEESEESEAAHAAVCLRGVRDAQSMSQYSKAGATGRTMPFIYRISAVTGLVSTA
jgi:hypothetical protein